MQKLSPESSGSGAAAIIAIDLGHDSVNNWLFAAFDAHPSVNLGTMLEGLVTALKFAGNLEGADDSALLLDD